MPINCDFAKKNVILDESCGIIIQGLFHLPYLNQVVLPSIPAKKTAYFHPSSTCHHKLNCRP